MYRQHFQDPASVSEQSMCRHSSTTSVPTYFFFYYLAQTGSKFHSVVTTANFGNQNKVHFWITHEILYESDINIEHLKFIF